jgi:plastocyanin
MNIKKSNFLNFPLGKIIYVVAFLMIVLMVGCATKQPEAAQAEIPAETVETSVETESTGTVEESADIGVDIQIMNKAFDPEELTVAMGSTVTWINMDETAVHSLSIAGKGIICPRKQAGEICEYVFEEAGTYEIMDLVNKFRGTITVTGGEE